MQRANMKTILLIVATLISACAATESSRTAQVEVAPLGNESSINEFDMTREELDTHMRRFADRYMSRIAIGTAALNEPPLSDAERKLMQGWKTASYAAVVDVAIRPDAVTNLLDMMTLTMLSRLVV